MTLSTVVQTDIFSVISITLTYTDEANSCRYGANVKAPSLYTLSSSNCPTGQTSSSKNSNANGPPGSSGGSRGGRRKAVRRIAYSGTATASAAFQCRISSWPGAWRCAGQAVG